MAESSPVSVNQSSVPGTSGLSINRNGTGEKLTTNLGNIKMDGDPFITASANNSNKYAQLFNTGIGQNIYHVA